MQITQERAIRELGIDPAQLLAPSVYAWPVPEVSQAQGVFARVTIAAALFGHVALNPARISELEQIGVTAESADRAPWIVKLSPRFSEGLLDIRSATMTAVVGGKSESARWVDLRMLSPLIVSGSKGEALIIAGPDDVRVWPLSGITVAPVDAVQAPVQEWLVEEGNTDAWLQGELDRKLQADGPWANITAAALFARFIEPTDAARGLWVNAALSGQMIGPLAKPRRWVCELSASQLRTAQELGRAEIDRLAAMLDDVAENAVPDVGSWQAAWLEICHGRDDLEGLCLLLREAGADRPLTARLDHLDRSGRVVRRVLPRRFLPADERTRRAHRLTPDAWWATE